MVTYKKFKTDEEAKELIYILKENDIDYDLENLLPSADLTFSGHNTFEDKVAIKLDPNDFPKVDKLLDTIAIETSEQLEEEYYLYSFSDQELFDIIRNFDEWGKVDFSLAQKILNERGYPVSDEDIQDLKRQKIEKLKQEESGSSFWMAMGVIFALFGGLLGIFIGYYHFSFQKTLPNGEKVYVYKKETRTKGKLIFYLSISIFLINLFVYLRHQI